MASRSPEFKFILPVAHTVDIALIDEYLPLYKVDVIVVRDKTYEVMKACDMAFIASGTATLEAAIIGTPMVVVYKASMLTYMTGKLFVLNNIAHFSLPNIVAEKKIVPELLQEDANPEKMVDEAFAIQNDGKTPDEIDLDPGFRYIFRRRGKVEGRYVNASVYHRIADDGVTSLCTAVTAGENGYEIVIKSKELLLSRLCNNCVKGITIKR